MNTNRDLRLLFFSTSLWVNSAEGARRGLTEKLSLRPGAPCDNFQGYCDVFLKCRQVRKAFLIMRLIKNRTDKNHV